MFSSFNRIVSIVLYMVAADEPSNQLNLCCSSLFRECSSAQMLFWLLPLVYCLSGFKKWSPAHSNNHDITSKTTTGHQSWSDSPLLLLFFPSFNVSSKILYRHDTGVQTSHTCLFDHFEIALSITSAENTESVSLNWQSNFSDFKL